MSDFDTVIRNGTIVDGSGLPAYKADLGIKNGTIAQISGRINTNSKREIDATGCIVAPGAVEIHGHYDAQVQWDPYCTSSGWHGVTTVTIGGCGFGWAPCKPENRDAYMAMLSRVMSISVDSLRKWMRWDWVTFPEYLDSIDKQGLGVNVASLVPFSPLRAHVMGPDESRQRTSMTDTELEEMKALFRLSMEAGAWGFSGHRSLEDRAGDGGYLPTHLGSNEEYLALAEILGEYGIGHIFWTRGEMEGTPKEGEEFIRELTRVSGRPLQWLGIIQHKEGDQDEWNELLEWTEENHKLGLPIYAQTSSISLDMQFRLVDFNFFDHIPSWVQPLVGTAEERMAKLRKPEVREAMKKDVDEGRTGDFHNNWNRVMVIKTTRDHNRKYDGLSVGEVASMMGKHPVDALLDLALDEDLLTELAFPCFVNSEPNATAEILNHPGTHPAISDGGAHFSFVQMAFWPTDLLSTWVRDRGIMSLEKAHYKLSALPAWIAGYRDRGMLREGMAADIIVYDFDKLRVKYDSPIFVNDLPGGDRRLIQKAEGYRYTLVNGVVTFEDDNLCTGALPGKLLRSYDYVVGG
jgi:N-acyl-D-amino-acid deacylase